MKHWESYFNERELKEIAFCRIYKNSFAHGTDGHNLRMIVARMEELLNENTKFILEAQKKLEEK